MFSLLLLSPFSGLEQFSFSSVHFLHLVDCIFLYLFKEFIHFLFKGLYYLFKIGLNVIFMCLSSGEVPTPCRISALCCLSALAVADHVLKLVSAPLRLGVIIGGLGDDS